MKRCEVRQACVGQGLGRFDPCVSRGAAFDPSAECPQTDTYVACTKVQLLVLWNALISSRLLDAMVRGRLDL
jgi:hypothetical protein